MHDQLDCFLTFPLVIHTCTVTPRTHNKENGICHTQKIKIEAGHQTKKKCFIFLRYVKKIKGKLQKTYLTPLLISLRMLELVQYFLHSRTFKKHQFYKKNNLNVFQYTKIAFDFIITIVYNFHCNNYSLKCLYINVLYVVNLNYFIATEKSHIINIDSHVMQTNFYCCIIKIIFHE